MFTELRLVAEWPETMPNAPWQGPEQVLGHIHVGLAEEVAADRFERYLAMEGFFEALEGCNLEIWSRTRS